MPIDAVLEQNHRSELKFLLRPGGLDFWMQKLMICVRSKNRLPQCVKIVGRPAHGGRSISKWFGSRVRGRPNDAHWCAGAAFTVYLNYHHHCSDYGSWKCPEIHPFHAAYHISSPRTTCSVKNSLFVDRVGAVDLLSVSDTQKSPYRPEEQRRVHEVC